MNVQLHQVLNLGFILFLAYYLTLVYLPVSSMSIILFGTMALEYMFIYIKEKRVDYFSFSSLSTAIGVMLMMITPYLWLYLLVISAALLQKQFLTIENRHFFNPSNFALLIALTFFYQDAHIVLGQLGDSLWLKLLIVVVALAILVRVNRWLIPVGFIVFYLLFEYLLVVSYDPVLIMEEVYHRFYSVSFMVFILFMLTDPKTTPSVLWQQLAFALFIALGSALFDRLYGFRVQHLFMLLFLFSSLVPLITTWQKSKDKKKLLILSATLFFLALSVIIFIQSQPPYYFEMDI